MPDKSAWAVKVLEYALEEVQNKRIEIYCDHAHESRIWFADDLPGHDWALRSDRKNAHIRDWLSTLCWERSNKTYVPTNREIDHVLNVLRGIAWKERHRPIRDTKLWEIVEQEPVISSVLAFMKDRSAYRSLSSSFYQELTRLAEERKIGFRGKRWPQVPAALTARLNKHLDILAQVGIAFAVEHTNTGNYISLKKLLIRDAGGDNPCVSSPGSSHINPNSNNTLLPAEDAEGKISDADMRRTLQELKGK